MRRSERLTVAQAATLLGVQAATVRARIMDGTLPARRVRTTTGDMYLLDRHVVEEARAAMLPAPPNIDATEHVSASSQGEGPRRPLLKQRIGPSRQPLQATATELEATNQRLSAEQARRVDLERQIRQLEEALAASQEQVAMLAHRRVLTDERVKRTELEELVMQLSEELTTERARRNELEGLVRQLGEALAASQEQVVMLAHRREPATEKVR